MNSMRISSLYLCILFAWCCQNRKAKNIVENKSTTAAVLGSSEIIWSGLIPADTLKKVRPASPDIYPVLEALLNDRTGKTPVLIHSRQLKMRSVDVQWLKYFKIHKLITTDDSIAFRRSDFELYSVDERNFKAYPSADISFLISAARKVNEFQNKKNIGTDMQHACFKRYFHADVLEVFSYPQLNTTKDKALVYVTEWLFGRDHSLGFYLLKKEQDKWRVQRYMMLAAT